MNRKPPFVIFYFCFEGFSRLGNINNHIRETVSWLAKFGHQVHFFNPDIIEPTFDAKVTVHPIPVINIPILRWIIFEMLSFFILIFNVFRFHPKLLYFRETSSFVPIAVSKLCHVPLTIEVNGWVLEELRQTNYSNWKLAYMHFNQRINFINCWKIIPVSEGLKRLLITNYPVPASKVIPVPNGTNPYYFKPIPRAIAFKTTGLPENKFTIGFIGSCYHYHGIQYLIHAAPLVVQNAPNVQFVISGDGAQLSEWRQLARDLHMNDYFIFTGKVPFNQAPNYINCFDIAVAPWDIDYVQKVGLSPMKLFDYLACSRPVVCSPVFGVKEIIEKYNCGKLVDVKDKKAFAEAIINLIRHPEEGREIGQSGRDVILIYYTWERTSRSIEKILMMK